MEKQWSCHDKNQNVVVPGDKIKYYSIWFNRQIIALVCDPNLPIFKNLYTSESLDNVMCGKYVFVLPDDLSVRQTIPVGGYVFIRSNLVELINSKQNNTSLKEYNTRPDTTNCLVCKTILKQPMGMGPTYKYCPKCEP